MFIRSLAALQRTKWRSSFARLFNDCLLIYSPITTVCDINFYLYPVANFLAIYKLPVATECFLMYGGSFLSLILPQWNLEPRKRLVFEEFVSIMGALN